MDWIVQNHEKLRGMASKLRDKLPSADELPKLPGARGRICVAGGAARSRKQCMRHCTLCSMQRTALHCTCHEYMHVLTLTCRAPVQASAAGSSLVNQ
jgi:hypothetical protein